MITFSIVLTTFNRQSLLPDVLKCLEMQTYKNFIVHLIDNGSIPPVDPGIFPLSLDIRLTRYETNQNVNEVINREIEKLSGTHFVWLGDDDLWVSSTLDKIAALFCKDDTIEILSVGYSNYSHDMKKLLSGEQYFRRFTGRLVRFDAFRMALGYCNSWGIGKREYYKLPPMSHSSALFVSTELIRLTREKQGELFLRPFGDVGMLGCCFHADYAFYLDQPLAVIGKTRNRAMNGALPGQRFLWEPEVFFIKYSPVKGCTFINMGAESHLKLLYLNDIQYRWNCSLRSDFYLPYAPVSSMPHLVHIATDDPWTDRTMTDLNEAIPLAVNCIMQEKTLSGDLEKQKITNEVLSYLKTIRGAQAKYVKTEFEGYGPAADEHNAISFDSTGAFLQWQETHFVKTQPEPVIDEPECVIGVWGYNDEFFRNGAIFRTPDVGIGENLLKPFNELYRYGLSRGIQFVTIDQIADPAQVDGYLFIDYTTSPNLKVRSALNSGKPKMLVVFESPLIIPENWDRNIQLQFERIFTYHDLSIDHSRFIKINYSADIPATIPMNLAIKNNLCTMIAGNKLVEHELSLYPERIEAIRWFERNHPDDFDLYGMGWDKTEFPSYKGSVKSKNETLKKYRFAICYENVRDIPGYITEKIFDCFFAGCIPVYWGASNITDHIPGDCFIDRRKFPDYESLYDHISTMQDEVYVDYLRNIKAFLNSDKVYQFSTRCFVETIVGECMKAVKADKKQARRSDTARYEMATVPGLSSIMVLAYNQLQYTKSCIESILLYTEGNYELFLVDNGSTDGTWDYFETVKKFFPTIHVVKFFHNRVAESAVNHVMTISRGEYFVFVSNDNVVHVNWLSNLVAQIRKEPNIGIVGPRSNNISGPQMMAAAYKSLPDFQKFAAELSTMNRGDGFFVNRMVGMCTLAKRSVLERVGGLDPYLPANGKDGGYGFSDDDHSLRMRLAGYSLRVANDVYIHHFGSITAAKDRPDLFGPAQNINKLKYERKLSANSRISISPKGEVVVHRPYGNTDEIPIPEKAAIRFPRYVVVTVGQKDELPVYQYASLCESYDASTVSMPVNAATPAWFKSVIREGEYDYAIIITNGKLQPDDISALISVSLHFPDTAIVTPAFYRNAMHRPPSWKKVELVSFSDMTTAVVNLRLIRNCTDSLDRFDTLEDMFWFFQRRVRGEGYFIAQTNEVIRQGEIKASDRLLPEDLVKEGKYSAAREQYLRDVELDSNFVESYIQLAKIDYRNERSDLAIALLNTALTKDENNIGALLLAARFHMEQDNLVMAKSYISQAHFRQPGLPDVQELLRKYELMARGRTNRYSRVLETAQKGLVAEAISELETMLISSPETALYHNDLGVLYGSLGDNENSGMHYQRAYELEPDNITFKKNYADYLYVIDGKTEQALKLYNEILSANSSDIEVLLALGSICTSVNQLSNARVFYQKVLDMEPENTQAQQGISTISRKREEARNGKTSIVILPTAERSHLIQCAEAIKKNTPDLYEVFLIEPSEGNDSISIRKKIDELISATWVQSTDQLGIILGLNRSVSAATGEFIALVQDAAVVTEGWLSGMLEHFSRPSHVGIVGPMIANIEGRQGVKTNLKTVEAISDFANAYHNNNRHRRIYLWSLTDICLVFRRELFEELGGFNEDLEDSVAFGDLCFRSALSGYQNLIAGDVYIEYFGESKKASKLNWTFDLKGDQREKLAVLRTVEEANEFCDRGLVDKAVDALVNGLKTAPDAGRIYHEMARIFIEAKRYTEAHDVFESMPAHVKNDIMSLECAAYSKEGLGLYEEADIYADRMFALDKQYPPALNLRGILAYKKGNKEIAADYFKKAIEADPGYGEPYTNLGVLKWSTEEKDEAIVLLKKGFVLTPTVADHGVLYYSAASSIGNFGDAEAAFIDAKGLYPNNRNIAFLLIDSLMQQTKFDRAMTGIEDALVCFGIDDNIMQTALSVREQLGPVKIDQSLKKVTLSLCMIVKNEEAHLPKCLQSVRAVVDEMIIVDTGSTDRTRDIAIVFGAQVFDFEWNNDFSSARNVSLSKASGDWILVLDADEVVSSLDHKSLLETINNKSKNVAYDLVTRNYLIESGSAGWTESDGEYPDEEAGIGWYPSNKVRLFRRNNFVRFENPVHEFVEVSLKKNRIPIERSPIPVHHYGRLNRDKTLKKGLEYYKLGLKKLEERGGDYDAVRELAVQAGELGNYEEAIEIWLKALALRPDDVTALFNLSFHYMKIGKYSEALEAAKRSVEISPETKNALLNYALCELLTGNALKTKALLEKYESSEDEQPVITGLLGAACCICGDRDKGLVILKSLLKRRINSGQYVSSLLKELISSGQFEYARVLIDSAISGNIANQETLLIWEELQKKIGNK